MRKKITGAVATLAVVVGAVMAVGTGEASADTVINGCNIVSEPSTTRYTNCPGADFGTANLDRVDLSYANLEGANFSEVSSFTYTKMYYANLKNTNFDGRNLQKISWVGADASGATLVSADMSGISNLPRLDRADLSRVNLSKMNTTFGGVALNGAILKGANLEQAYLYSASLKGADLSDARLNFADLSSALFTSDTKLDGADLSDTLLSRVDFTGTAVMPKDIVTTADSSGYATVSWTDPVNVDGVTLTDCSRASGTRFEVYTHVVNCKVQSESSLNLPLAPGSGRFFVTVNPLSAPNPDPVDPGNPGNGTAGSLGSPFGS